MKNNVLKRLILYLGIILLLLATAYAFVPEVLSGKVVDQSDISGYMGMAKETSDWDKAHPDDRTAWTNSMFGGMPTVMLTGNGKGDWTKPLYDLMFIGPRPASYLFISLFGAFLLMLALGINPLPAAGGAIAVTFCSYNFQIIQVGHNAKMVALAFAPWVLAAFVWTYRKALESVGKSFRRRLPSVILGAALFAMALNFQIKANHVQISYYLAIIILSCFAVLAVWTFVRRKDRIRDFFAASLLLLVLGCVGIAVNANRLIPTYDYSKHTMRGGSELASDGSGDKSKGLDLEYATAWSYGWEELPNMMIPDYNGGSSATAVNPDKSATIRLLKESGQTNLRSIAKALPLYWGPQPFTAGPMYMGAITIFLFVMGLGLYKGKEKWWVLIPSAIGILLALGNHFMPFTEFWYKYIPFYSKFRTVSMALVILQLTLPVLAFLTLDRIVRGVYDRKDFARWSLVALVCTAGFCFYSMFGIGRTFTGPADSGQPDVLVEAFIADRKALLRKDALEAFLFIAVSFCLLWWGVFGFRKENGHSKERRVAAALAICVLVLVNMFGIGKRYLNSSHFVARHDFEHQFTARPVDKLILEDKSPDYRVLDLSVNVFNDSYSSYFHKSIGGYSPVKLQRYQDLIDRYLVPEINAVIRSLTGLSTIGEAQAAMPEIPVLSMLNDKYIIIDPDTVPLVNENANGNCWLVDSAVVASGPDEEIALLGGTDLRSTAVIGQDFKDFAEVRAGGSESDFIELESYAPNELRYNYEISSGRTAVFSEIYYPDGWTAVLDNGQEVELFRADWTLRAAHLPAGKHTLTMRFEPRSYVVSSDISRASSAALFVFILLSIAGVFAFKGKNDENAVQGR